jgi:predicted metal-dependent hydrolase
MNDIESVDILIVDLSALEQWNVGEADRRERWRWHMEEEDEQRAVATTLPKNLIHPYLVQVHKGTLASEILLSQPR